MVAQLFLNTSRSKHDQLRFFVLNILSQLMSQNKACIVAMIHLYHLLNLGVIRFWQHFLKQFQDFFVKLVTRQDCIVAHKKHVC